ncbi:Alcohol dehydrogenase 4, mitochondrial [Neolecta irregularis DAH-3]|uniref:alcohol dehydrogenase n=1 Tax=Neolecta irregularis (strain DAH-3) TaxID=1198029 RepID=A0A1U7LUD8_NEOID|nr:Alcohol dehydrogenase 4, mitochondrial [Neolecta irregularis DAH-3]|eukprot:OLL26228.1 Alcohol dehydrogenase 4, mitochondrial [Neolecta irregularis DAH-3]
MHEIKSIPKTQFAWITHQPGKLRLREIDVANPGKGEILIKIEYSGLCHTDIHIIEGDCSMPQGAYPLISGHEGVGRVVKIGDDVHDIEMGDPVGIHILYSCDYCFTKNIASCLKAKFVGVHVGGAHQQYAIAEAKYIARIPKELPLALAAPVMCGGLTSYSALKDLDVLPGQWVAISGAGGGLGHLGVQYAKALGYRVIAVDGGEMKRKVLTRLKDPLLSSFFKFVLSLGADHFIDYKTDDHITQVRNLSTGGVQALIVFSSHASAYEHVFEYLRPRGTVVVAGVPPDGTMQIDVFTYATSAFTTKGILVGTATYLNEALDYVVRGIVKPYYHLLPFSKLPQAIDALKMSKVTGRIVLDLTQEKPVSQARL